MSNQDVADFKQLAAEIIQTLKKGGSEAIELADYLMAGLEERPLTDD